MSTLELMRSSFKERTRFDNRTTQVETRCDDLEMSPTCTRVASDTCTGGELQEKHTSVVISMRMSRESNSGSRYIIGFAGLVTARSSLIPHNGFQRRVFQVIVHLCKCVMLSTER